MQDCGTGPEDSYLIHRYTALDTKHQYDQVARLPGESLSFLRSLDPQIHQVSVPTDAVFRHHVQCVRQHDSAAGNVDDLFIS